MGCKYKIKGTDEWLDADSLKEKLNSGLLDMQASVGNIKLSGFKPNEKSASSFAKSMSEPIEKKTAESVSTPVAEVEKNKGGRPKKVMTPLERVTALVKAMPTKYTGVEAPSNYFYDKETGLNLMKTIRLENDKGNITDEEAIILEDMIEKKKVQLQKSRLEFENKNELEKESDKLALDEDVDSYDYTDTVSFKASVNSRDSAIPLNRIIDRLRALAPNISVITDYANFVVEATNRGFNPLTTPAFYDEKTQSIYINPNAAKSIDAVEEFAHLWLNIAKKLDVAIYNKGIQLITDHGQEWIDAVKNDPTYDGLSDEDVKFEALSKMIAERGLSKLEAKDKSKVMQWLKDFWKAIANIVTVSKSKRIDTSSNDINDYIDKVAKEVTKGKVITQMTSQELVNVGESYLDEDGNLKRDNITIDNGLLSDRTIGNKFKIFLKDLLLVNKGVRDKDLIDTHDKAIAELQRYQEKSKRRVLEYQNALNEYMKNKYPNKSDRKKNMGIELKNIHTALTTKGGLVSFNVNDDPSNIITPVLTAMREDVDNLSAQIAKAGWVGEDLELKIMDNIGVYLNTSYLAHTSDEYAKNWRKYHDKETQKMIQAFVAGKIEGRASRVSIKNTGKSGNKNVYEVRFSNSYGSKTDVQTLIGKDALKVFLAQFTHPVSGKPTYTPSAKMLNVKRGEESIENIDFGVDVNSAGLKMKNDNISSRIDEAIKDIVKSNREAHTKVGTSAMSKKSEGSIFKSKNKNIDPIYAMILNQIEDPALSYEKTIFKQAANLFKREMEHGMLDDKALFTDFETNTNKIRITPSQSQVLGGKWTSPEMFNFLTKEVATSWKPQSVIASEGGVTERATVLPIRMFKIFTMFSAFTKTASTVYSPGSNAVNFFGGVFQLIQNGSIFSKHSFRFIGLMRDMESAFDKIAKNGDSFGSINSYQTAIGIFLNTVPTALRILHDLSGGFKARDTTSSENIIDELISTGLMNSDVNIGLMNDMMRVFLESKEGDEKSVDETIKKMLGKAIKSGAKTVSQLDKAAKDSYALTDNVFKAISYFAAKEDFEKTYGSVMAKEGMSKEEIENQIRRKAADFTKNTLPTYSMSPKIIKKLSRFPYIAPFVQFEYQSKRNLINMAFKQLPMLISDSVKMREQGYTKESNKLMVRALKLVLGNTALFTANNWVESIIYNFIAGDGGDDDDDKDLKMTPEQEALHRNLGPDYFANSHVMKIDSRGKGDYDWISFSRINPADWLPKLVRAYNQDGVSGMFEELLNPYTSPDIFAGAFIHALMNEDDFGNKISVNQEFTGNLSERLLYLLDKTTRSSIIGQVINLKEGYYEENNKNFKSELLNVFTGIKPRRFEVSKQVVYKMKSFKEAIDLNNDQLTKLMENEKTTKSEIDEERKKADERINSILTEARYTVNLLRKNGYSEDEIRDILSSTRVDYKGDEKKELPVYFVEMLMDTSITPQYDENGEIIKPSSGGGSSSFGSGPLGSGSLSSGSLSSGSLGSSSLGSSSF